MVDSSGWLEYFAGSERATFFERAIEDVDALMVPAIALYEVYKVVLRQRSETDALSAVAFMRQGRIVAVDADLALLAAELSVAHGLPMADAMILATARTHEATLWTQDGDFEGLEGVRFIPKR